MTHTLPKLVRDLLRPTAELVETHISWVLLDGDDVLKLKKPVSFAFLDFSTLAARKAACEAELALNRRLAPDVYLGLVAVTRDANGTHRIGGDDPAEIVEWAVHMRRLSDDDRADVRLARGQLGAADVETVAERLVRFHEGAELDATPGGPGSAAVLAVHAEENLAALDSRLTEILGPEAATVLRASHRGELARVAALLDARRTRGRARDGHGDLRLDHVYLSPDGEVRILDCVEFDRAFRVGDVAGDVAFFAMSLREAGRDDLAERFVARVARDSGDHDLYSLLRAFETYWALVRAKVTLARAQQEDVGSSGREADESRGAALVRLAARLASPAPHPRALVGIGGPIAVGKSSLAVRIGETLGAPVLESDRLRKQLDGLRPTQSLVGEGSFAGRYSEEATTHLYDELERRAAVVLESGRSCVVDASFRESARRTSLARLAEHLGASFAFIACEAPRHVLEERLRAREGTASVSDARLPLLDDFLARYEPPRAEDIRLDTSAEPDATWAALEPHLKALLR